MRTKLFFLTVLFFQVVPSFAQRGIGTNNPSPSAALEVASTTKGMLIPRMTTAQRNAIAVPAEGLRVYDINTQNFWYYDGSAWVNEQVAANNNPWDNTDGSVANQSSTDINYQGGNVGIGKTAGTLQLEVNGGLHVGTYNSFVGGTYSNESVFQAGSNEAGRGFVQTPWLYSHAIEAPDEKGAAGTGIFIGDDGRFNAGDDQISLVTSGNQRLFIQSNGATGIGTTSPSSRLEVNGRTTTTNFTMTNGAANGYILQSDATGIATWVDPTTISAANIYNTDGSLTANRAVTQGSFDLNFDANTLVVSGDDNRVGIGTNNPTRKLDVNGIVGVFDGTRTTNAGMATEADGGILNIGTNDGPSNRFGGTFNNALQGGFIRVDSRINQPLFQVKGRQAGATTQVLALMDVESDGALRLNQYGSGGFTGTATGYLGVDANGNVIETAVAGLTPDGDAWGVAGEDLASGISRTGDVTIRNTNKTALTLQTSANASSNGIAFQNTGGNYTWAISREPNASDDADAELVFSGGLNRGDVNTLAERMRLDETGRLGLNTNDPSARLDVNGRARIRTLTGGAAADVVVTADADGNLRSRTAAEIVSAGGGLTENIYSADGTLAGNRSVAFGANDLNFDANTLVIDGSADRIGIGTANPNGKLSINSNGVSKGLNIDTDQAYRGAITLRRTNNANEIGIGFQNSGNGYGSAIFHRDQNDLDGLDEALSIATIGNETDPTLLGETATFKNNGTIRFHDYGTGANDDASPARILGVQADGDMVEVNSSTLTQNLYNTDGSLTANRAVTQGSFDLNFDANTLVVSGDDNRVGIGTTTPSAALSVAGNINTAGSLDIGELGSGDRTTFIDFHAEDGVDRSFRMRRFEGTNGIVQLQNNGTGEIQFLTDFGSTRMTIGSSANDGNVGIGIVAAEAKLDVNGNARVRNLPAGAAADGIVTTDANGNLRQRTAAQIVAAGGGLTNNLYTANGSLTANRAVTQGNFDLNFDANTLVIDGSADRIGIGTANPDGKLNINSNGVSKGLNIDTDQAYRGAITLRRTDNANEIGIGFQNSGNGYGSAIFHRDQNDLDGLDEALSIATIGNENDPTLLGETATFKNDGTIRFHGYGTGANDDASPARILGVQADGDVVEVNSSTLTQDLYNTDGSLTANRAVTQGNFDLNFDANTLVVSGDNNRVGIGNPNPNAPLTVGTTSAGSRFVPDLRVGNGDGNTNSTLVVGQDATNQGFIALSQASGFNRGTLTINSGADDANSNNMFIDVSDINNTINMRFEGSTFNLNVDNNNTNISALNSGSRSDIFMVGNNIGINEAVPTASLDVDGDARVRTLPAGVAADGIVTTDANGNLRQRTAAQIVAAGGGANGDAWGITGEDIVSNISRTGSVTIANTNNAALSIQTPDNTASNGIAFQNSGAWYTWNMFREDAGSSAANLVFAGGPAGTIGSLPERMRIAQNGNVGIGTNNPGSTLALGSNDNPNGTIQFNRGLGNVDAATGSDILLSGRGMIAAERTLYIVTDADGTAVSNRDIIFGSGAETASSIRSHMMINGETGKVGIGTLSPSSKLAVHDYNGSVNYNGNIQVDIAELSFRTSQFSNTNPNFGRAMGGLGLYAAYNNNTDSRKLGGVYGQIGSNQSGHLIFTTMSSGSEIERMTITEGGNVGIGTSSPSQRLHVVGNIFATGTVTTSDSTLKTQIQPIASGASQLIASLNPVSYRWKQHLVDSAGYDDVRQLGFLAQEMKAIIPEAVYGEEGKGMGIDYNKTTPVIVKAMQEQQDIIEQQQVAIETQEQRIQQLESQLLQIKALLEK